MAAARSRSRRTSGWSRSIASQLEQPRSGQRRVWSSRRRSSSAWRWVLVALLLALAAGIALGVVACRDGRGPFVRLTKMRPLGSTAASAGPASAETSPSVATAVAAETAAAAGPAPASAPAPAILAASWRPLVASVFPGAPTGSLPEADWPRGADGQLVRKIAVFKSVPAPKGLAISPDGNEVWVTALVTRPSIGVYDPSSGKKLGSVDVGKAGAVEVIFSRDGSKAYASEMQTHRVYEIDTAARRVVRSFDTKSPWTKVILLSPDETKLYAANWSGDDVSEIDLASGKLLRRIKTADTPRGLYITPDGAKMYVACFGEQTLKGVIQVFDLQSGTGRTIAKGRAMRHMVADATTARLFTSDLGGNCIWVTDLTTNETHVFAKTDNKPNTIDISPDGRVLFVSCRGANSPESYYVPGPEWGSILLFDTRTGKPLDAIVGGNQCTALDVSDDGRTLAFSDFLDGKLRVYRVPSTATLLAGGGGAYRAHLTQVRKDGKRLVVKAAAAGGE